MLPLWTPSRTAGDNIEAAVHLMDEELSQRGIEIEEDPKAPLLWCKGCRVPKRPTYGA